MPEAFICDELRTPLGVSGARRGLTTAQRSRRIGGGFALRALCLGAGQGIAMIRERT
ncbi:hypothetical protein [Vannielia litorea]|uniref:hypothetical protein n=1 Tax=Vannielia litorea TaxID=1217970 RepID=UPI001BCEA819|nr:hypothetical protein [Vannielia litorea]MBS8226360.1 hypothetical protein [Vannielia litorea]